MDLLTVANNECQRLRELAKPYTAPELFPDPPIQSNQVKAALFAVQQALDEFEKKFSAVVAKTSTNKRVTVRKASPKSPKKATS